MALFAAHALGIVGLFFLFLLNREVAAAVHRGRDLDEF